MKKRILALLSALALCLGLTGCGFSFGGITTSDVQVYVQGYLDTYYSDTVSDDFLELMDTTLSQVEENREEGYEVEFAYMCNLFMIVPEVISDELVEEGLELIRAAYSHSRYTVKQPARDSEGNFLVEVEVYPVELFALVYNGDEINDFASSFADQWSDADVDAMTDEEYQAYEDAWARGIYDLCWAVEPTCGNGDMVSTVIQVKAGDNGNYSIVDSSFQDLDMLVLDYYG